MRRRLRRTRSCGIGLGSGVRAPWLRLGFIGKEPRGGFDLKGGEREGRSEAAGEEGRRMELWNSNERYYCDFFFARRGI